MNSGDTCRSGGALATSTPRRRTTSQGIPWSKTTTTDWTQTKTANVSNSVLFTAEMSKVVLSD
eukprot:202929-Pyramimonas_sp.AAC.1